jgi:hypothetical protein
MAPCLTLDTAGSDLTVTSAALFQWIGKTRRTFDTTCSQFSLNDVLLAGEPATFDE